MPDIWPNLMLNFGITNEHCKHFLVTWLEYSLFNHSVILQTWPAWKLRLSGQRSNVKIIPNSDVSTRDVDQLGTFEIFVLLFDHRLISIDGRKSRYYMHHFIFLVRTVKLILLLQRNWKREWVSYELVVSPHSSHSLSENSNNIPNHLQQFSGPPPVAEMPAVKNDRHKMKRGITSCIQPKGRD